MAYNGEDIKVASFLVVHIEVDTEVASFLVVHIEVDTVMAPFLVVHTVVASFLVVLVDIQEDTSEDINLVGSQEHLKD